MNLRRIGFASIACLLAFAAAADDAKQPWLDASLDPDRRAELVVGQMTREEKQPLV